MKSNLKNDYCSWFPDTFCGVYLGDLCYDHDAAYEVGDFLLKLSADMTLSVGFWRRANRANGAINKSLIRLASIGSYIAVSTVGIGFWLVTKLESV